MRHTRSFLVDWSQGCSISGRAYDILTPRAKIASIRALDTLFMYIIPIGWLYVALMMSVAEATSTQGSLLGAVFTFLFYGALPVSLVLYFMGAPARKRAIRAREAAERAAAQPLVQQDAGSHAAPDAAAPVRQEP